MDGHPSIPTKPEVFIIESLSLSNERDEWFEGRLLQHILRLNDKKSTYFYIRTRKELGKIALEFGKSRCRYLHLSCHANTQGLATTFDSVTFQELGRILRPHLGGRRVFLSACEMATRTLANQLLKDSGCYSVVGPTEEVGFSDAALLWSSFYHLMFRTNPDMMQRRWLLAHLRSTVNLFGIQMRYFASSRTSGVRTELVSPKA